MVFGQTIGTMRQAALKRRIYDSGTDKINVETGMLITHEHESMRQLLDQARDFERAFLRDYVMKEVNMIRHQRRKRALTEDESRACAFALEILAQLDKSDANDKAFVARRELRDLARPHRMSN